MPHIEKGGKMNVHISGNILIKIHITANTESRDQEMAIFQIIKAV